MTRRNIHFNASAVGLLLIIIMLGRNAATGSVFYRIVMGVAYPALFVLMGYAMRLPNNWKQFLKQTAKEALILLVPSYTSYFFVQLYTYANKNWGSVAYWNVYMNYMKDTFQYSASRSYGDIPSIGIVWLLISVFFTRLIINGVWVAVKAIFATREKYGRINEKMVARLVYLGVGLVGMALLHRYVVLPLNLSTDLLLVLITMIGMIWKENAGKVNKKWHYIVVAIMVVIGVAAIINNRLMDLGGMSYPGQLISVVLSLCCIIPVIYLIGLIANVRFIRDALTVLAKHAIEIIIAFELSSIYSALWALDYPELSVITNVICAIALAFITAQTIRIIKIAVLHCPQEKYPVKYYKEVIIAYYITVSVVYISAAIPWGALTKIIPINITNVFIVMSAAMLMLLYSMAIPMYRSIILSLSMTAMIVIALLQATVIHNQNTIVTLTLLAGTSIFSSTHIIGRIIWTIESVFVLLMYYLSINGYIPYTVVGTGAGNLTGHSFGILGKNELAALLLSMSIAYCIGRKSDKRYWMILDIVVIGLNSFINYRYVGGRSDFALTALLLVGTVVYRLIGKEILRFDIINKIIKILHYIIGIPIYIFTMIACIAASWFYDGVHAPFEGIISKFTDATTYADRLWLSKTALLVYKPKFWGQYIFENPSVTSTEGAGYFWIDCSYVRLLLMFGVAVTCIILIILTFVQYKNAKNKNYYLVFIGIIVALMGIMGHRIPQYLFNPLPAIMLADSLKKSFKTKSSKIRIGKASRVAIYHDS